MQHARPTISNWCALSHERPRLPLPCDPLRRSPTGLPRIPRARQFDDLAVEDFAEMLGERGGYFGLDQRSRPSARSSDVARLSVMPQGTIKSK